MTPHIFEARTNIHLETAQRHLENAVQLAELLSSRNLEPQRTVGIIERELLTVKKHMRAFNADASNIRASAQIITGYFEDAMLRVNKLLSMPDANPTRRQDIIGLNVALSFASTSFKNGYFSWRVGPSKKITLARSNPHVPVTVQLHSPRMNPLPA